jgi:hypothetical protein
MLLQLESVRLNVIDEGTGHPVLSFTASALTIATGRINLTPSAATFVALRSTIAALANRSVRQARSQSISMRMTLPIYANGSMSRTPT